MTLVTLEYRNKYRVPKGAVEKNFTKFSRGGLAQGTDIANWMGRQRPGTVIFATGYLCSIPQILVKQRGGGWTEKNAIEIPGTAPSPKTIEID